MMTEPTKPPISNQPKKQMRSVEASRAIWQTQANLTTSELLLLQALGSHADEHFECYPSTGRLATMTRLSKRQVIRILRVLRTKGLLAFDENRGGRKKCNHYRLLIPAKDEKNGDTNSDIVKSDTLRNGDISNTERVTSCTQTVTNPHVNGDIAMSPEWVEGFLEGVRTEGGEKLTPPLFENDDITPQDIEENPSQFLETVFAEGISVIRDELCDDRDFANKQHGPFVRHGWLWRNWLVWKGHDNHWMLYNRWWFKKDQYAITVGGGAMANPGRYLTLLPPINGADAITGSPYFTQNPGDPYKAWDTSITFNWMPRQYITFVTEFGYRHANVPYWTGRGGITPGDNLFPSTIPNPGAGSVIGSTTWAPGPFLSATPNYTCVAGATGWCPDMRHDEPSIRSAIMVKF